jgi:hypothetical protein
MLSGNSRVTRYTYRNRQGASSNGPKDGRESIQTVRNGRIEVAETMDEEPEGFLMAFLTAVENDHLRYQFLFVGLQSRQYRTDVVRRCCGLIGSEELEEAETSLPPFCW